jgi:hypothetical protein
VSVLDCPASARDAEGEPRGSFGSRQTPITCCCVAGFSISHVVVTLAFGKLQRLALAVCTTASLGATCRARSPLDPAPELEIDRRLVGTWRCVSGDADARGSATASVATDRENEREFLIRWEESEGGAESFRAFVSAVQGSKFLNVRSADDEVHSAEWAFLRYSFLRRNVLYLELVPDAIFEDEGASPSPIEARATLEWALESLPDVLQEFCVCVRRAGDRK